eukprot:PhF_6_TR34208/c0_g1_i1/m.50146
MCTLPRCDWNIATYDDGRGPASPNTCRCNVEIDVSVYYLVTDCVRCAGDLFFDCSAFFGSVSPVRGVRFVLGNRYYNCRVVHHCNRRYFWNLHDTPRIGWDYH